MTIKSLIGPQRSNEDGECLEIRTHALSSQVAEGWSVSEASDLTCDREKKLNMLDGRYTFDIWKIMGHTMCIYIYDYIWVIHGK